MKKFNLVSAFWLLLALIAFIIFAVAFSGLWRTLSFMIFPTPKTTDYSDPSGNLRSLISTIPMLILGAIVFILGTVKGFQAAKGTSESA